MRNTPLPQAAAARHRSLPGAVVFLVLVLVSLAIAHAQQSNAPRLGYVSPAGARQGSTVMVIVGGQYLEGATNVLLSGDGIEAKVVEYFKPIQKGQANSVRDKLKRLLDKKAQATKAPPPPKPGEKPKGPPPKAQQWSDADEMLATALRKKLAAALRGPGVPATAESVLVQISIGPDAEPGRRDLRLETPKGWTNPLVFCVGQLREYAKEPTEDLMLDTKAKPKSSTEPVIPPPEPPTLVPLPCVANGQIPPGGADRYQFEAHKGQRLVFAAETRTLIPYISDAVPGWFQGALTLCDASGRELAYADHFLFDPEPVLLHEVSQDGTYVVEIRDALYRGREDFVYRLSMGELPFLTGVFPLGGKAGEKTTVALEGCNLPATTLELDHREDHPGIYPFRIGNEKGSSNVVPFAIDDLPEAFEKEPNDEPGRAQSVTLPLIVNGRLSSPDERDVFRFQGEAGQDFVAEVYARRLRSPLDSVLTLKDASGNQIARNDDHEDKSSGLNTHHSDSYLRATLPAAGTYTLSLSDTQHQGGPEFAYRLRLSPPRPDFELRMTPSRILARAGSSVPVTVFALRKDGFAGPIDFALADASEGLTLSGGPLAPDKDQADLTVKVLYWTGQVTTPRLHVEGRATVAGQVLRRTAVPAEYMTQAFEYKHLVPASDLKMTVTGRVAPRIAIKVLDRTPIKITPGQTAKVKLSVSPPGYLKDTVVTFSGKPPPGFTLEKFEHSSEGLQLVLRCEAGKVKPGQRGTLSLLASPKPVPKSSGKTPANQPSMPPSKLSIPFEIVKPAS